MLLLTLSALTVEWRFFSQVLSDSLKCRMAHFFGSCIVDQQIEGFYRSWMIILMQSKVSHWLLKACKWVVFYILSLSIIHLSVFMPSKYITLNNLNSAGNQARSCEELKYVPYLCKLFWRCTSSSMRSLYWYFVCDLDEKKNTSSFSIVFWLVIILNLFLSTYWHFIVCILIVYSCTTWSPVPLVLKLYTMDGYQKTVNN